MRTQKRKHNRSNRKRILTLGLLGVMIFSFGGSATATNYNDEYNIPVSTYWDDNLEIDPVQGGSVPRQRSTLESSYVSPYVTSIKNQNPYGTCWSFATMAASEASMIKEGFGTIDTLDLSEWQLVYFTANSVADSLGGTRGDYFTVADDNYLDAGGNQQIATYRLANWYGVVNETTAPYTTVSQYGITEIEEALAETLPDGVAYSQDVAHLENAYWISMKDMQTVKQLIKQYGACGASYYSADAYYSTGTADAWNTTKEVAVYCPTAPASDSDPNTNHAITIVGWDDNYAKENFNSDAQPTSDGAWYCKNSWGTNWSKDGYFWISYEDVRLLEETAFFYDYGTANNYDNNYQYDGGAWGAYFQGYDCMANIYTAQQTEYLRAVGFYTDNSNYNCTVYIYKDVDSDNPYSGTLVLTQSANQLYAGFHTVELNKTIEMKQGESYSVVVYQTPVNGGDTQITIDNNVNVGWFSNTAAASEGQSFIGYHGESMWDVATYYNGNCRIKAYTDNKVFVSSLELNESEISLYTGDNATLEVTLAPEDADDKTVEWSSSDESVATVDENGVVTAIGVGVANITCAAQDGSGVKTNCSVTVKQWVTSVALNYSGKELAKDEMLQLTATVLPATADDKSVVWKSSDEGVATVSDNGVVKAIGYGETTITCTATDRNQCYATCKIMVYEPITMIALSNEVATLDVDDTLRLVATVTPDVSRTKGVYWTTTDSSVATVDDGGLVTAVSTGQTTIQCIAKDGSGVMGSCSVTVQENIEILEKGTTLSDVGNGAQYIVTQSGTTGATVQLTGGKSCSGTVTIPDSVVAKGVTYKVASVADGAFAGNKSLTKVKMGSNITSIGKNAFNGCSKLTSVTIGKNVTIIGDKAFYKCSRLGKIVIPEKVNKIGKHAFYKCSKLKSITIKTSKLTKKKVGKKAFYGIHSKATIKVPKKKLASYKVILKSRGIGKKVKVKKY